LRPEEREKSLERVFAGGFEALRFEQEFVCEVSKVETDVASGRGEGASDKPDGRA
jgi:hypothetical protein